MSHITEDELNALQASDLSRKTPFAIGGVSNTQLSIARYYGGCKYLGQEYRYVPATDELIRRDVIQWLTKYRKNKARAVKNAIKQDQMGLGI